MGSTLMSDETEVQNRRVGTVEMKLEVVVIPVSDVERAKRFYGRLGWRLDADFVVGETFRGVQYALPRCVGGWRSTRPKIYLQRRRSYTGSRSTPSRTGSRAPALQARK